MTIEEAVKILKETSPYLECNGCNEPCVNCEFREAYNLVINELSKGE